MTLDRTAALVLVAGLLATPAAAQDPRYGMIRPGANTTTVSVNFAFPITLHPDDTDKQQQAMESARRRLYEIADKECKLLLATIASTCRLARVNVSSNVNRRGTDGGYHANMSASASYQIELKPEI